MSKKIPHGLNIFDLAAAADIAELVWDRESPENAMIAAFDFLLSKCSISAPVAGDDVEWLSGYGWIGGKVVGKDGLAIIVRHNDGYAACQPGSVRLLSREGIKDYLNARESFAHKANQEWRDSEHYNIGEWMFDAGYRKHT